MADYIKNLKGDLVEQFKDKPNIEALYEVIGEQLDDLFLFFEQLRTKRSVYDAEGKQLDGVGDIVVLSRLEAAQMEGTVSASSMTDEQYRKYLIYKILKNTCDCTYYDIMKAIGMFWDGPPLKYTEDPEYPATMIFDFDAGKDLADQAIGIPFVRAGGVGMYMRMHKSEEANVYVGFALQRSCQSTIGCNVPVMEPYTYLADETDTILVDEIGAWLIE